MHKEGVFPLFTVFHSWFHKYMWDFFAFTLNSCGEYNTRLSNVRLDGCKVKLKKLIKFFFVQKDPCRNTKY